MTRQTPLNGIAALTLAAALTLVAGPVRADQRLDDRAEQPNAQNTDKAGADRKERSDRAGHVPELRDETFRLMDAYLISNLQESLGLTDEQFAKALPRVKKLQSDRRDFAKRRMQALRLLRRTLLSGSATEASVSDLLRDLKSASADERAGTALNLEALDALLTPIQQAKYRVFEAEVDIRLRHLLARSQDRNRSQSR